MALQHLLSKSKLCVLHDMFSLLNQWNKVMALLCHDLRCKESTSSHSPILDNSSKLELQRVVEASKNLKIPLQKLKNNFKFLRSNGCTIEDICRYTKLLKHNKRELKEAVSALQSFGIESISMKMIGNALKSDKFFQSQRFYEIGKSIRKLSNEITNTNTEHINLSILNSRLRYIEDKKWKKSHIWRDEADFLQSLLNDEKYIIYQEATNLLEKQSYKTLIPKINFLQSKGYTLEEMFNSKQIFICSKNQIQHAYEILKTNQMHYVSLESFSTFLRIGKIQPPRKTKDVKILVTDLIGFDWSANKESHPPLHVISAFANQERLNIIHNYNFLLECGFRNEDLCELFIILGHEPKVLKWHWDQFREEYNISDDTLSFSKKSRQEKIILLNLLQYNIEKRQNFKHSIVLSDTDLMNNESL